MSQLANINRLYKAVQTADKLNNGQIIRKVAFKERCKHGMRFEYCGICQKIEGEREYKFPIHAKDKVSGKPLYNKDGSPKLIWLDGITKTEHYRRYR